MAMHFYASVPLKGNVLTSNIEDSKGCKLHNLPDPGYKELCVAPHYQDGKQTAVMEPNNQAILYVLCHPGV